VVQISCLDCRPSKENRITPIAAGLTSNQDGKDGQQPPIHHHSHQTIETNELKVRFWLESAD
jgi:hypothetical protein